LQTLNTIIEKNKIGVDAGKILEDILSAYIAKLQLPSISTFRSESPSDSLIFIIKCRNYLRSLAQDKLSRFIRYLNSECETIPDDLCRMLSAFFSVYETDRYRLNPLLLARLTTKDVWNDKIEKRMELLLTVICNLNTEDLQLSALQQLSLFENWIPRKHLARLTQYFISILDEQNNARFTVKIRIAAIPILPQLRHWIMPEYRESILAGLLTWIYRADLGAVSCEAITELSVWGLPLGFAESIKKDCEKYQLSDAREQELALIAFEKLMPVLPMSSHDAVLNCLLLSMMFSQPHLQVVSVYALSEAEDIISLSRQQDVMRGVIACLNVNYTSVCIAACMAFGNLNKISANHDYMPVFLMFMEWLKDKEIPEKIRMGALFTLKKVMPVLPHNMISELLEELKVISMDVAASSENRKLALRSFSIIYHQCQQEEIYSIIAFLMAVVGNRKETFAIRIQAIAVLKLFDHWVYGKENKHILEELLSIAEAKESGYLVMINIYKLISKAKYSLYNDAKIASLAKDHLLSLENTDALSGRISIEVLTELSHLINGDLAMQVINACILKLNHPDVDVRSAACNALDAYQHHLNSTQKISLLCGLFTQSSFEADVLLTKIYKEYRNELSVKVLENLPTPDGRYLDENVMQNIMRYTF
jgi:hypothetical protein